MRVLGGVCESACEIAERFCETYEFVSCCQSWCESPCERCCVSYCESSCESYCGSLCENWCRRVDVPILVKPLLDFLWGFLL